MQILLLILAFAAISFILTFGVTFLLSIVDNDQYDDIIGDVVTGNAWYVNAIINGSLACICIFAAVQVDAAFEKSSTPESVDIVNNDWQSTLRDENGLTLEAHKSISWTAQTNLRVAKERIEVLEAQINQMKQGTFPTGEMDIEDILLKMYNEGTVDNDLVIAYLKDKYEDEN